MSLFRKFRALFRKRKLDAEMSEEMRAHLELQMRENLARGMSSDEARYAARRQFGGIEQAKETPPAVKTALQNALAWKPNPKAGALKK